MFSSSTQTVTFSLFARIYLSQCYAAVMAEFRIILQLQDSKTFFPLSLGRFLHFEIQQWFSVVQYNF